MSIYMMRFGMMSFGVVLASLLPENIVMRWSVDGLALVLAFLSLLALALVLWRERLRSRAAFHFSFMSVCGWNRQ
jgi:hypothetical protein